MALCEEEMPARLALNKIKQLMGQFSVGFPGSAHLRVAVHQSQTTAEAREAIVAFFTPLVDHALV
jgi:tRNA-dihydrouridine synthase B